MYYLMLREMRHVVKEQYDRGTQKPKYIHILCSLNNSMYNSYSEGNHGLLRASNVVVGEPPHMWASIMQLIAF
jgi:hypothetical protein